jgi:cysteinyl-tRNA synthetase
MKVYNTLSGKKEDFKPEGDEVRMYVCGVTPYDDAHIGHAMSYVIFDVIRRYLRYKNYKVKYVQNVTDIDDKIIDRANKLGVAPAELAEKFTKSYFEDMKALNIEPADVYPRATGEIDKIIEVIAGLVDRGYAYPAGGSVYFRVRNDPDYGQLSHRSLEAMRAAECAIGGQEKEDAMDFVLWKAAKPGEPHWPSPWGEGRPGWHIECSAMSLRYLGETLDIHGGGQDLVFPHHENEIAQSEGFTGQKPFVKYWLHNGLVQLGGDKMSKSLGNLITIKQALEKYSSDALRIFILSSHYRSPLTYSEEGLEAAERGLEGLLQAVHGEDKADKPDKWRSEEYYSQKFIEAMDDDFNTAQALALLFSLAKEVNWARNEGYLTSRARSWIMRRAGILGLTLEKPKELSFEDRLYNKTQTLEQYALQNFKEALKPIEEGLPQLEKNESIYISLLRSLRNKFAHGTYTNLDEVEEITRQYTRELNDFRNLLVHSHNFKEIQDSLRTLSNNTASNIGTYSIFREQLRKAKQWQFADEIRTKLAELGATFEDTPEGPIVRWKRKR